MIQFVLRLGLTLACFGWSLCCFAQTPATPEVLRAVGQLWTKTEEGRLPTRPIGLEFVVNYYDPAWGVLWIGEGDGSFLAAGNKPLGFKSGDRISVTGFTVADKPEINWAEAQVKVVHEHAWGSALSLTNSAPAAMPKAAILVEVDGYLTALREGDDSHCDGVLKTKDNRFKLHILRQAGKALPIFGEAAVRVRGVNSVTPDPTGKTDRFDLWVPSLDDVKALHPVAESPEFSGPITLIGELREKGSDEMAVVEGFVREQQGGRTVVVADESGQVTAETWQTSYLAPGSKVRVAGYPVALGTRLELRQAIYRAVEISEDDAAPRELKLAADVRNLSAEEAGKARPVTLRGVVTWSQPNQADLFFQDSSAGIYVWLNEDLRKNAPGAEEEIEVSGVTGDGAFAPFVEARSIRTLGRMHLPPAHPLALEHALTGTEDGQWVEMDGYLRQVKVEGNERVGQFSTPGGDFDGLIPGGSAWTDAVGSIVRVKGVCGVTLDERKVIKRILLWIPEVEAPEVLEAAPVDPFSSPERSLRSLGHFNANSIVNRRIKTRGVVTARVPGRFVVLQDGTDGIVVLTRQTESFEEGDLVEASGFIGRDGSRQVLREGICRKVGQGTTPAVKVILEGEALNEKFDSLLVRLEGVLLEISASGKEKILMVQSKDRVHEAIWPANATAALAKLHRGSRVALTGVGRVQFDEYREARAFRILLRSREDLVVLKEPPVMTAERALLGVGGLGIVVLLGAGWVRSLRAKVKKQTAQLAAQLERQTLLQTQYRTLIESASDWIFTVDREGKITSFNPAGERITGYAAERALGLPFRQLVHADDVASFKPHEFMNGRDGEIATQQFRVTRVCGGEVWIETKARRVRQTNGGIQWLGVGRDITERKQIEKELKQAKEVAEQTTRAKGEFLANMSHEIRTPMNGVIGMSNLLMDTSLSPEQRDFTETIRGSAEALMTVINDILDFSKIEAGKLTFETLDFDLRDTVESTLDLLATRAAAKGIELNAFLPYQLPCLVRGDAGRLRQVLMNLLGNAIKFTERGEVSLTVALEQESEREVELLFEVADTGIGISEEAQARLFQPFSQADTSTTRKYGGTGLGLAISQRIVDQFGGKMAIRSREGEGSTFAFTITFEKQTRPTTMLETGVLKGLRALIVDDNPTNRKIVHHYIISWGMRNGSVASGPEALAILRKAAVEKDPYSIVLLDYQMPEMDGVMLAEKIKADPLLKGLHMVMLTSLGTRLPEDVLKRTGIELCLQKPMRQSELYNAMATVVSKPAASEQQDAPASERAAAPVDHSHLRILLAEDNPVNQKVALRQLEKLGYKADAVSNGREAMEALARINYDAVLMDCQMPEMDGYEATRAIRQHPTLSRTYVIAMTANAMQGDREKCLEAGMNDYLSKPTRLPDLKAVLEKAAQVIAAREMEDTDKEAPSAPRFGRAPIRLTPASDKLACESAFEEN